MVLGSLVSKLSLDNAGSEPTKGNPTLPRAFYAGGWGGPFLSHTGVILGALGFILQLNNANMKEHSTNERTFRYKMRMSHAEFIAVTVKPLIEKKALPADLY